MQNLLEAIVSKSTGLVDLRRVEAEAIEYRRRSPGRIGESFRVVLKFPVDSGEERLLERKDKGRGFPG
jgi:hypothetical protein